MTSLVLPLLKEGETPKKLSLNLRKEERFTVRASWEGKLDLDLHAIVCVNSGSGAKASSFEDILSSYNIIRKIDGEMVGTLEKAKDGTFSVYGGALVHSPDAEDGDKLDVDEWITIAPNKLAMPANGVIEIPLVVMIHQKHTSTLFRDVPSAAVTIENADGKVLLRISLSEQFGGFTGVQMGSIMIDNSGSSFVPVGVGFNQDFNGVLAHFS